MDFAQDSLLSSVFYNARKVQTLWCTFRVRQAMTVVSFSKGVIKSTNSLKYFGIHLDKRNNCKSIQQY